MYKWRLVGKLHHSFQEAITFLKSVITLIKINIKLVLLRNPLTWFLCPFIATEPEPVAVLEDLPSSQISGLWGIWHFKSNARYQLAMPLKGLFTFWEIKGRPCTPSSSTNSCLYLHSPEAWTKSFIFQVDLSFKINNNTYNNHKFYLKHLPGHLRTLYNKQPKCTIVF